MAASGMVSESEAKAALEKIRNGDKVTVTEYWKAVAGMLDEVEAREKRGDFGTPDAAYVRDKNLLRQLVQTGVTLEPKTWKAQLLGPITTMVGIRKKFSEFEGQRVPEVAGAASYALVEAYLPLLKHFGNSWSRVDDSNDEKKELVRAPNNSALQSGFSGAPVPGANPAYKNAARDAQVLSEVLVRYSGPKPKILGVDEAAVGVAEASTEAKVKAVDEAKFVEPARVEIRREDPARIVMKYQDVVPTALSELSNKGTGVEVKTDEFSPTAGIEFKDPMTLTEYWKAMLKLLSNLESKYGSAETSDDEGYKTAVKAIKKIAKAGEQIESTGLLGLSSIDSTITAARSELKGPEETPVIMGEASLVLAEGYLALLNHFANEKIKISQDAKQRSLVQGGLEKPAWGKNKSGYQDASDAAYILTAAIKKYKARGELEGDESKKSPEEKLKDAKASLQNKYAQAVTASTKLDRDYHVYHEIFQVMSIIKMGRPQLPALAPAVHAANVEKLHIDADALLKSRELKAIRHEVKAYEGSNAQQDLYDETVERLRILYDEDYPSQSSLDVYNKMLEKDHEVMLKFKAAILKDCKDPEERKLVDEAFVRGILEKEGLLLVPSAMKEKCDKLFKPGWVFEGAYRRAFADILAKELTPRVRSINGQMVVLDQCDTTPEMSVIRVQEMEILRAEEAQKKREEAERKARETRTPIVEERVEIPPVVPIEKRGVDIAALKVIAATTNINQALTKYRAMRELLHNQLRPKGKGLAVMKMPGEDAEVGALQKTIDDIATIPAVKELQAEMEGYKGDTGVRKLRNEIEAALKVMATSEDHIPMTAREIYTIMKQNELISPEGQKKWDERISKASTMNVSSYRGGTEEFHRGVLASILAEELNLNQVNEQLSVLTGINHQEEIKKLVAEWKEVESKFLDAVLGSSEGDLDIDEISKTQKTFLIINKHDIEIVKVATKLFEDLKDLKPDSPILGLPKNIDMEEVKQKLSASKEGGTVKLMRELIYATAMDEVERILRMDNRTDQHVALRKVAKVIEHASEAIKSPRNLEKIIKLKETIQEIGGKSGRLSKGFWKVIGATMVAAGTLVGDKSLVAKGWATCESGYYYGKKQMAASLGWLSSHADKLQKEEKKKSSVSTVRGRSGSTGG